MRASLVLLACLLAGNVEAANPESMQLSPEAALGAAVLAADDDGGGGWYNPASLGGVRRASVRLGLSAYSVAWVNTTDSLVTTTPWSTQRQGTSSFRYSSVPSVLGLTWKLADGLGLSVGLWTPFHDSFSAGFDTLDSGPFPNAPGVTGSLRQRFDWSHQADDTWGAAAVGWQLHPRLRLGVSAQAAYSTTDRWVEFDTTIATDSTNLLEQGAHLHVRVREKTSILAVRGVLGVQWNPLEPLHLAFVVHTPRAQLLRSMDRVQVILAGSLLPGYGAQEISQIDVKPPPTQLHLIDTTRLLAGARLELGRLSLRADAEWSPAFAFEGTTLREGVRLRLGALYTWNENVTVGVGGSWANARLLASEGNLALNTVGLSGGITSRSNDVIRALGGSDKWDLLSTIGVAAVYGYGAAPGIAVSPLNLSESVLPVLPGSTDQPFIEVPTRSVDVSVHLMSTLKF
jgi:hypothetical protein